MVTPKPVHRNTKIENIKTTKSIIKDVMYICGGLLYFNPTKFGQTLTDASGYIKK